MNWRSRVTAKGAIPGHGILYFVTLYWFSFWLRNCVKNLKKLNEVRLKLEKIWIVNILKPQEKAKIAH